MGFSGDHDLVNAFQIANVLVFEYNPNVCTKGLFVMISYFYNSFWKSEIAVDLGTAKISVASGMHGNFICQSRINGRAALHSGVVSDRSAVVEILKDLLSKAGRTGLLKPRAVACAPSDATSVELDAIKDCVGRAGVSAIIIVPEPLAAAIGAGVDISSSYANMILDIGEGVTDCAIIKEGQLHHTQAVRIGCEDLRNAVGDIVWKTCGTRIKSDKAEQILREIGVLHSSVHECCHATHEHEMCLQSLPAKITLNEIRSVIMPILDQMLSGAVTLMRNIPPEMGCEIIENGIHLTGGGALLKGMRELVELKTHLDVITAQKPLGSVITGARAMLPVALLQNRWEKCH